MEQTVYIQHLQRELRKERKRTDIQFQVIVILSVACITLACMLAVYSNLP